jgi:hypothetical protein
LTPEKSSNVVAEITERRISWLTIAFGATFSLSALPLRRVDWAAGLFCGAALAWCNFRWLRRGLDAFIAASVAQRDREKPKIPLWTYAIAVLRYGLLAATAYAIFEYLHVPLVSIAIGFCSLGLAASAASVWEIWTAGN